MNTPILLLIFNRLDQTKKVFSTIRRARPTQLFIAADGPRTSHAADTKECDSVRNYITTHIDWNCKVHTLFRKDNIGCKMAVSSAISWFFSQVECGIILEDDCLPHPSFFSFCEELLAKYKDDTRVMMISGNNFQQENKRGDESYYFSKYCSIWGWASWKRAWDLYDVRMANYPTFKQKNLIKDVFASYVERLFWQRVFSNMHKGIRDTWDHQWAYAIVSQHGLSITPNCNLVSNIGFGQGATRTSSHNSPIANLPTESIGNHIVHPKFVLGNTTADNFTFWHVYAPMVYAQAIYYFIEALKGVIWRLHP